jgi:hypothetical protein
VLYLGMWRWERRRKAHWFKLGQDRQVSLA